MNGGQVDDASRLWKEDLEWLRTEFYEGHFGFPLAQLILALSCATAPA